MCQNYNELSTRVPIIKSEKKKKKKKNEFDLVH